jgi:hypothetical protein
VNPFDPATKQLRELVPLARTLGIAVVTHQPVQVRCRLDRTDHLTGAGGTLAARVTQSQLLLRPRQ